MTWMSTAMASGPLAQRTPSRRMARRARGATATMGPAPRGPRGARTCGGQVRRAAGDPQSWGWLRVLCWGTHLLLACRHTDCPGDVLLLQCPTRLPEQCPPWCREVSIQPRPTPLAPGMSPQVGSPKKVLYAKEEGPESRVCGAHPAFQDRQARPPSLGEVGGCPISEPHSPSKGPGPRFLAAP